MGNIISTDTTWEAGTSYAGEFQVANGATLTIEEGVKIFGGNIIVAGNLVVAGSQFSPVQFDQSSIKMSNGSLNVDFALFQKSGSVFKLDGVNDTSITNSIFVDNFSVFNDKYGYETYSLSNNIFVNNNIVFNRARFKGNSIVTKNDFKGNSIIFDDGFFFGETVISNNNFYGFDELITAPLLGYGYGKVIFSNNYFENLSIHDIETFVFDGLDDVRYSTIQFSPVLDELPNGNFDFSPIDISTTVIDRFGNALSDSVARQTSTPGYLADWHFVTQCPASDNTQKSHVDHSISLRPNPSGQRVHMGQFSVKIWEPTGSLLSENQHLVSAACATAGPLRGKNACPAVGLRRSSRQTSRHLGNVG